MKYRIEYKHRLKDFIDVWNIENKYLSQSTISSIDQIIKWNEMNNDIHIFIRDVINDKIVGEATILPLNKNQFDDFINNEFNDTELIDIISYTNKLECYLLFSVIAIDINYRNEKIILSLLLEGINKKLDYLINNGITFLNMCAVGETEDGRKFIENFLKMKYINDTKEGYKIYSFESKEEFDNWKLEFSKSIDSYKINNNIN